MQIFSFSLTRFYHRSSNIIYKTHYKVFSHGFASKWYEDTVIWRFRWVILTFPWQIQFIFFIENLQETFHLMFYSEGA